jgi:hypothetical protein
MSTKNELLNRHTIANYFARAHLRNGIFLGGNEQQILAQAGLTATQLKHASSRILATQLASIVKSCWQVSGDELLGFTKQKVKIGMFTLLAERLITCKTLEEVFTHAAAFYNLTGEQLQLTIERSASHLSVKVNASFKSKGTNTPPNSLLSELLLLICHRFPSWLAGQLIPLVRVNMQHAKPAHHKNIDSCSPAPVFITVVTMPWCLMLNI